MLTKHRHLLNKICSAINHKIVISWNAGDNNRWDIATSTKTEKNKAGFLREIHKQHIIKGNSFSFKVLAICHRLHYIIYYFWKLSWV